MSAELNDQEQYENCLNKALAEITKSPMLTSGILSEAAKVIAKIGCTAINASRIGIWRINHVAKQLDNIISFSTEDNEFSIQEDFSFANRPQYTKSLSSERMIVIHDAKTDKVLTDLADTYSPDLGSMLDIPIRNAGALVGVLCVEQNMRQRNWTPAEQFFCGSLADLTALAMEASVRRQAMIDLDNNKRQTSALMANLPGMVYRCLNDPPEFTFTFVSEGCLQLSGYTAEELMHNNSLKFFDMIHPDDVDPLAQLNRETLSIGLPLDTTFRMVMKDGTIKWVWERSRVVEKHPDGTPHILEGFYTDITEQRRLEAAELANRDKAEFLTTMSGMFKEPINEIADILEKAQTMDVVELTDGPLKEIKEKVASIQSMVDEVTAYNKLEAGTHAFKNEPYSVPKLLEDLTRFAKDQIGSKPIQFTLETTPGLPEQLIGDEQRVRQVAVNLLQNAVRFTEDGTVKLRVEVRPISHSDQVMLAFSVKDTGSGIKQEDIPFLFDYFFRSGPETVRKGFGLGLCVAKLLAERMGGSIRVESDFGKGSLFNVDMMQKTV